MEVKWKWRYQRNKMRSNAVSETMNPNIQLYMAPLEGITGYIYRNAQHEMFGEIDKYYAPFIDARMNRPLKSKEIRDILPENNGGLTLVPQEN